MVRFLDASGQAGKLQTCNTNGSNLLKAEGEARVPIPSAIEGLAVRHHHDILLVARLLDDPLVVRNSL